jgi:hypothetical protein
VTEGIGTRIANARQRHKLQTCARMGITIKLFTELKRKKARGLSVYILLKCYKGFSLKGVIVKKKPEFFQLRLYKVAFLKQHTKNQLENTDYLGSAEKAQESI